MHNDFYIPIGIPITEKDLPVLVNLLHSVAFKWQKIAVQLNLVSELHNIRDDLRLALQGHDGYLREILFQWLRQNEKTTLGQLIDALKSESVGEKILARSMLRDFKYSKSRKGNQLHCNF